VDDHRHRSALGHYKGKDAVITGLFAGLRDRLATPVVFSIDRVIEEGEWAVLIATGAATTVAGQPYNNTYCIVAHVVDGRFVELTDYVDTDLMTRVLLDAP
jgi:uncharacterized protein